MASVFIIIGSIIMVGNIIAYYRFVRTSKDVMLYGKHGEPVWEKIGLLLLVFFLIGYLVVAFAGNPDYMMAGILFFGAVFVSLVLVLMYYLVDSLKDRSLEIAETLIGVIEARDPNLNGHSRNVEKLSMCLYKYLPPSMKEGISPVSLEYAALLHDVGKLGVPESILNKPGKLDPGEWEVMKQHPRIAMDLLKSLPSFDEIKDWILYHHERIDGKGYYGLPGDEITLPARLIAVCDTYSAITMKRSYKESRTYEEAVEIMKDVAGSQLDPDLVNVFLTIPKEELQACTPRTIDFANQD